MSFIYSVRQARGVTVVDLSGRITLSELCQPGSGALQRLVHNLVEHGNKKVVLNLRDVSSVDSSGISELVGCFTTVHSQGGVLKLSNANEHVKDLLGVVHLFTLLDLMEDDSADQALSKAAA